MIFVYIYISIIYLCQVIFFVAKRRFDPSDGADCTQVEVRFESYARTLPPLYRVNDFLAPRLFIATAR